MSKNTLYIEYLKDNPGCELCLSPAIECHHLKSVGSMGYKRRSNKANQPYLLISVCRRCHRDIHDHNLTKMCYYYPHLTEILTSKGWEYDSFAEKWILPHTVVNGQHKASNPKKD